MDMHGFTLVYIYILESSGRASRGLDSFQVLGNELVLLPTQEMPKGQHSRMYIEAEASKRLKGNPNGAMCCQQLAFVTSEAGVNIV